MESGKRLGLRDAVLALLLAALQGLPAGEASQNPSPLVGSNWGNPRRYVHLQTSTDFSTFYLELRLDGSVRRATARTSYSVILLKAETRERMAIFGVKSSRYLCMDVEGNPFTSPVCLREECLFNHKLLENNRDVYYSARTGILFNLEGSRQVYAAGQNVPQTALFLPKKNTVPLERLLLHREKRNQVVADPSDPHNILVRRTEDGSDSRAVQEDDGDMDLEVETEVGDDGLNASRETPVLALSNHDPRNIMSSRQANPWSTGASG